MAGRIYLLNEASELMSMEEAPYDSERLLQEMLANHPDLLAGEQINSNIPRRWLLVMREMAVPGEEDGAGRWSLDHLFLDQDAVPTLIEVKRSSDTRIRREVIGQMLDYAANAVAYWPVEEIRARFESRCERENADPIVVLTAFLGEGQEADEFWLRVKTNLQAGRVRMVFLADAIPPELRRVVEFLNEQMDPAEVLAIEIKQFVGKGVRTLVPRVLGQTETARQKKTGSTSPRENITDKDFMEQLTSDRTAVETRIVRQLVDWSKARGLDPAFRQGKNGAAFIPTLNHALRTYYPISVQTSGNIVLQMRWMKDSPPFDNAAKRSELFNFIRNIPNLKITDAGMEGFPKLPIQSLADERQLQTLTDALDWIVKEIRTAPPT